MLFEAFHYNFQIDEKEKFLWKAKKLDILINEIQEQRYVHGSKYTSWCGECWTWR